MNKDNQNKNKVPNSDDLFSIYKEQLETIQSIDVFITTNKIDKRLYKRIDKNLKMTSDLVETVFKHFDVLSGLLSSKANAITMQNINSTLRMVEEVLFTTQSLGNGKINLKQILKTKISITILGSVLQKMMSMMEDLGGYSAPKMVIGSLNVRVVNAAVEEMLMATMPLSKVSLKTLILNRIRIWRLKKLFKRLFKFVEEIGRLHNPLTIIAGTATLALTGFAMEQAYKTITSVGGINIIKLIRTNIALKRMARLLFGKHKLILSYKPGKLKVRSIDKMGIFDIVDQAGSFPILTMGKAMVNLAIVERVFNSMDKTFDSVHKVGFFKAWRIRNALKRMNRVLFGKHKVITLSLLTNYGALRIARFKINRMGMFDLVGLVGAVPVRIAASAAVTMVALNIFFKAFSNAVKNIGHIGGIRAFFALRSLKNISKILFGKHKVISIATTRGTFVWARHRMGIFDIVLAAGMYPTKRILMGTANIMLISLTTLRIQKAVLGLAILAPIAPFAWISAKLIRVVVDCLVHIYVSIGRHYRLINKATHMLKKMAKSLLWFTGAIILAGVVMLAGLPLILLATLIIGGFVYLFSLIGSKAIFKTVVKGSLALFLVATSVITFSLGILLAALAIQKIGSWENFGMLMAVIGGVVAISIVAGLLIEFVALGALGIALLGLALVPFSISLLLMAKAIETISQATDINSNIFADIIRMIINGVKVFFEEDNWKYLNPITLGYVMVCMGQLMFITLNLGVMASVLRHIASLNMPVEWDEKGNPTKFEAMQQEDFVNAATNAATILQFFAAVFDDKKKKLPNGVIVGGAMAGLENIKLGVAIKVRRLRRIVKHLGKMADTLQHIASLNIPIEWNDKGKPTKFQQMTSKDFLIAGLNAASILMFFAALFKDKPTVLNVLGSTVRITPLDTNSLENISGSTRRKIKKLKKIVGYVGEMADTIQKISTLAVPDEMDPETGKIKTWRKMEAGDFTAASTNVATIMTTLVGAISSEDLATQLDNMSRHAAKNFGRVMEGMSGISGIMDLITMLAGGEVATKFKTDDDPKSPTYGQRIPDPTSYKSVLEMVSDPNITNNVKKIFDVVIKSMAPYNQGDDEDLLHDAEDEIENIQTVITGASESVTTIMAMYKEHLADLDPDTFQAKYSAAASVMVDMVKMFSGTDVNIPGATTIKQNIAEVNKLLVQVDKVNLDKLKAADSLMKNISDLSKSINGNFRELARAINEDLLEALQKLVDKLEDVKNTDFTPTVNTTSMADLTPAKSGTQKINEPKQDNKPNQSNQAIAKDVAELKIAINKISRLLDTRGGFPVRLTE